MGTPEMFLISKDLALTSNSSKASNKATRAVLQLKLEMTTVDMDVNNGSSFGRYSSVAIQSSSSELLRRMVLTAVGSALTSHVFPCGQNKHSFNERDDPTETR